jgi:hypothetical protein
MTARIFISYSHRDEAMLERLHTHLAMLRRESAISDWHDRMITAGQKIDSVVDVELESCQIFLPLVSPDFLASNYCYEKEMQRAIARHEEDRLKVIPIILEPCDWAASPLSKFKALPKDGKPVSDWSNQNAAWLNVVAELRKALNADPFGNEPAPTGAAGPVEANPSKYRIKRSFDAIDRENFREECFNAIADYFRKSIDEINTIDGLRGRFERLSSRGFTATILNRNVRGREGIAHITVRAGSANRGLGGDISYSFQENAPETTSNGGFSIEGDNYRLFLKLSSFSGHDERRIWLPQEAASRLWDDFIGQAGISYG